MVFSYPRVHYALLYIVDNYIGGLTMQQNSVNGCSLIDKNISCTVQLQAKLTLAIFVF